MALLQEIDWAATSTIVELSDLGNGGFRVVHKPDVGRFNETAYLNLTTKRAAGVVKVEGAEALLAVVREAHETGSLVGLVGHAVLNKDGDKYRYVLDAASTDPVNRVSKEKQAERGSLPRPVAAPPVQAPVEDLMRAAAVAAAAAAPPPAAPLLGVSQQIVVAALQAAAANLPNASVAEVIGRAMAYEAYLADRFLETYEEEAVQAAPAAPVPHVLATWVDEMVLLCPKVEGFTEDEVKGLRLLSAKKVRYEVEEGGDVFVAAVHGDLFDEVRDLFGDRFRLLENAAA